MGSDGRSLIAAYEASVDSGRRRRHGVHYTPGSVAERLTAIALEGIDGPALVCDPACGAGSFLLAAADLLATSGIDRRRVVTDLLFGIDRDADAVAVARDVLREWSGGAEPGDHLVVGDALAFDTWDGRFDAVVGNPPFLNQLERATVRPRGEPAAAAAARFGAVIGAYTDTSTLFLVAALDMARRGGRVVLVQPESLLAARDAAGARAVVHDGHALEGLWVAGERVFTASVSVCAPIVRVGAEQPASVRRWSGAAVAEVGPSTADPRALATWSALVPLPDVPEVDIDLTGGVLADLATATAGFRDEFYGLAAAVIDVAEADARRFPPLVTSGLVEPGRVAWGERPARFAKQRLQHPRVDLAALDRTSPRVARWVADRLVPKVVVATQSRVVEAAVDQEGAWVPSTPVIAVHAPAAELWRIGAALLAPPVTAWARRSYAGTALSQGAVKLSAKQVLQVPLPRDRRSWQDAADALQAGEVVACATAMTRAHGCDDAVLSWWCDRAKLPNPRRIRHESV